MGIFAHFFEKWWIATVSKNTYIGVGVTAGIPVIGAAKQLIEAGMGAMNALLTQDSHHREERMSVESRLHVKSGVEYNGKNLHTINLNVLHNITGNIIKEAGKST